MSMAATPQWAEVASPSIHFALALLSGCCVAVAKCCMYGLKSVHKHCPASGRHVPIQTCLKALQISSIEPHIYLQEGRHISLVMG